MQNILCIDVSTEPAQAVVVSLSEGRLNVLEQHHTFLGDSISRSHMLQQSGAHPDTGVEDAPEHDTDLTDDQPLIKTKDNAKAQSTLKSPLAELVSKVETEWTDAVMIVPPYDYLSLTIELPFQDTKSINKIIDLEVQDLVPFEVDEFVLAHQTVASNANGSGAEKYDVHVGILPKTYMRNIVSLCKSASFEPLIITTSSSILATPYLLAPNHLAANSVAIFDNDPSFYITSCVDGKIRSDRVISRLDYLPIDVETSTMSAGESTNRSILIDLKLSIASLERRYGVNFEKVYYIGRNFSVADLQQHIGRTVERLKLREFVSLEDERGTVAALASLFVRDENPALALNNFRVREFSYSPQLTQLFRGFRGVAPYLLALLVGIVLYLSVSYLVGKFHIRQLQSAMRTELTKVLPNVEVESGNELPVLVREVNSLRDQLTDVALISSHTPMELLAEVARIIPDVKSITVKSVKIRDYKVTITGSAPDYQDIENLATALKKSSLFKQVKPGENSGSTTVGGGRSFSFEVSTEESSQ